MLKKYKLLATATVVANKNSVLYLTDEQAKTLKGIIQPVNSVNSNSKQEKKKNE